MYEAIILVGGRGTRLAPFTNTIPKPLLPIGEQTILELILLQLRHYGFTEITLAVGYMAPLFEAIVGDGERFDLHVRYSHEHKPLGTVGPLTLIDHLSDTFLVMNGDTLTTMDYGAMLRSHIDNDTLVTIATTERDAQIDFGVIETDDRSAVLRYTEKPCMHHQVSMGVYGFTKSVLDMLKRGQRFDLPDLIHWMLDHDEPVSTYPFSGYWLDIGRHDDYERANREFEDRREMFLPTCG
jgi:NDP-sugar pyrophosphorylase family protein